jgi:uncharacterized protein YdaU (DUF1376 family)
VSGTSWYKRYPADFLHSTAALSLEEKGAYSVALDLMYERGGPIPDDPQWIARMCGCSQRKWTQVLRPALIAAGKLQLTPDGKLMNSRVSYETHESAKRLDAARRAGSRGGTNKARTRAIIDPINSDDLWSINDLAEGSDSTPADSDRAAPVSELSSIYRPDNSEIFETKINEINTPALADSGLRKESKKEDRGRSLVSTPENQNQKLNLTQTVRAPKKARACAGPVRVEWEIAFKAFYAAYPRKKAPDLARAAFFQRMREGVPADEIMAGLARQAFDPRPKFVKHPATWLHAGCWRDEPDEVIDEALAAAGLTPQMIAEHRARQAPPAQQPMLLAVAGGRS